MQYYDEIKWCESCRSYVNFLLSLKGSYCIECGSEVFLFSKEDMRDFRKSLQEDKDKSPMRRAMKKRASNKKG